MKLTKRPLQQAVENTETVCEITQVEFDVVCAKTAAKIVTDFIGPDAELDDIKAGLELTAILAHFVSILDNKLFNDTSTIEHTDKKEEK